MRELIDLAKQKPGALNYGTFGSGSSGHLNIELLQTMTGTKFTAVHYRGAAPAITDVLGGHIQMVIVSIGLIAQPWQDGKLKVLGFGSTQRLPQFPDVPTLAESGLPGYEAGSWYGLAAPNGTPRAIVDKIGADTQKIFQNPAFRGQVPRAQFHLLDREPARAIRRAHPCGPDKVGQGHPRRQREGRIDEALPL